MIMMQASFDFLFRCIQLLTLVCGAIAIRELFDWQCFYFESMPRIKSVPNRIPPNHFYARRHCHRSRMPLMSTILGSPKGYKMRVPLEIFQQIYNEAVVMQQMVLHRQVMLQLRRRPKPTDTKYREILLNLVEDIYIYDECEREELLRMADNDRIEYIVTYKDPKQCRFIAVINMCELYGDQYFEDYEGDRYFIYHFILNK